MAAELRLILLGLGVALVVGLWWWERRRSEPPRADAAPRGAELLEPRLGAEEHPLPSDDLLEDAEPEAPPVTEMDTQELPARRAPTLDRPVPRGDPPVVTIDNLPEETIDVVFESPATARDDTPVLRTSEAMRTRPDLRRRVPDPPIIDEPEEIRAAPAAPEFPEVQHAPEPEISDEEQVETPPRHQRIIAVRLLGRDGQRMEGKDLKAALGSEGLEFGRYSIYHRVVDGSRPLYSVASLVEPGSFDPAQMESLRFPGISLFAVFPGPLPAPQCFDELLATARRLADRLGGSLQDESGSSLTGQRVLSIREDLVHFEHLVSLSRTRPRL
jgi:cell division protein ZipA